VSQPGSAIGCGSSAPHGLATSLPVGLDCAPGAAALARRQSLNHLVASIALNEGDFEPRARAAGEWYRYLALGRAQPIQYTAGSGPLTGPYDQSVNAGLGRRLLTASGSLTSAPSRLEGPPERDRADKEDRAEHRPNPTFIDEQPDLTVTEDRESDEAEQGSRCRASSVHPIGRPAGAAGPQHRAADLLRARLWLARRRKAGTELRSWRSRCPL
jgi:hypothetical protein